MGPNPRGPGDVALITGRGYEVMRVFPRAGFNREGFKDIMCRLCRDKPQTTYDNVVGAFGRAFGTDGVGGGRDQYVEAWEGSQGPQVLLAGLDALETLDPK